MMGAVVPFPTRMRRAARADLLRAAADELLAAEEMLLAAWAAMDAPTRERFANATTNVTGDGIIRHHERMALIVDLLAHD